MLAVECYVLMISINLLFIPFPHLPYLILSLRTSCAKPSHIMCLPSARYVLSIITIFINAIFYLISSPFYYLPFILFIAVLSPSPFGEGWGGASSLTSPFGEGRGGAPLFTPTTYDRSLYSRA